METDIALHWFILAQIFGVITIILDFISYQIKEQRRYLLWFSIGSLFWTLMFITIGAQIPVILAAGFSFLRGMVFWWIFAKNTKGRKIAGKVFLYIALALGIVGAASAVAGATPETRWLQIFMLVTAILFIIGQYLPSKHYVRIFALFYATAVLLLNTPLDTFNPMGILIELAKIVSIAVFYVKMVHKPMGKVTEINSAEANTTA